MSRHSVFSEIYAENLWNGTETKAGPASTMALTEPLRELLPSLFAELGITSILEAGCSEALWQPELPGYIGVDIVPQALEVAQERHPTWTFMLADIVSDPLPMRDAILCRHVLQHLSIADTLKALENFKDSGARYLIASTNHRDKARNADVDTGGFYRCYLQGEPFNLGEPIRSLPDVEPMTLDVWEL